MNGEAEFDDSDLKACSCGGQAHLHEPDGGDDPWWWVQCAGCLRKTGVRSKDFRAVEDWNAIAAEKTTDK